MASPSPVPSSVTTVLSLKKRSLVPAKWAETVRTVGMKQCREAGLSLAYAFASDDYAQYVVSSDDNGADTDDCSSTDGEGGGGGGGGCTLSSATDEEKWRLHVDILTYTVASHCMSGLVTTVGPEFDSVALWYARLFVVLDTTKKEVPPGKHLDGWWTQLRSGAWRLYFQLSEEGKKRYFQEILPLLHDTKAEVLGDREQDAWYLVFLGTKPNSQGRGYAARLLRDAMGKADSENRPMYLESSSQTNIAYYKKFGFEVKREISLGRGPAPVRLWIMVREPHAPSSKVTYTSSPPNVKKFSAGGLGRLLG
ncbi:hypothetical protein N0V88_002980 [Collariella sp. IMI 366227]|nr:hypothetical protein N0V88_002980 [Collariella sp. IMI 366227]